MKRILFGGLFLVLFCRDAFADFSFQTLNYPGSPNTFVTSVDGNIIAGTYSSSTPLSGHGFIYDGSSFTTFDVPGSTHTYINRVQGNNVVGTYTDINGIWHGFAYDGSSFKTLDPPLANPQVANRTQAFGISGTSVVGIYNIAFSQKPYLFDGTSYLDLPSNPLGTNWTATDIYGSEIIGNYLVKGQEHIAGYLFDGSTYTAIDYPPTYETDPLGIDADKIVGVYRDFSQKMHGFLYQGGNFTTIDAPGPNVAFTEAEDVYGNKIVGFYQDRTGTHGFIATIVPEPTSAALIAFAAMIFGMQRSRKRSI